MRARRVWDSRGRPTVEAEVALAGGAIGRAIVPAGASKGSREALELRDGGAAFGGLDVSAPSPTSTARSRAPSPACDADDQAALDARLIELDGTPTKSRLGANATLAVSMAAAHAAAAARGVPLYEYLGGADATLLPMPQIQIFGGGAHAGRRVDIQDFMVVCPAARSFAEALEWTAEVYRHAGRADGASAAPRSASPTKAAGGPTSPPTSRRSRRWSRRSSAPASRRASRSRSRSTSPPPSSAATAATRWASTRASSTATA